MSTQIQIGDLTLGGGAPIRVQSMTNTDTMDTQATVEQTLRLVEAGCELVRITAPDVKAAENLYNIKNELARRGCTVPLVADIHFNPLAAETAATIVEKVRVNPGNYTDRNTGKTHFTEQEYADELKRIGEKMSRLIEICKQHHTAMRIGTNHGSLSERIMSRYGNTPEGMAQSAIEFAQVCREQDYHQLVFSMKASNVQVMVQSTRLFVEKMHALGMDYPIHLGVTEAGDAMEARYKSAAGIGALLIDGIGDTIRVSLTDEPEEEVRAGLELLRALGFKKGVQFISCPTCGRTEWDMIPVARQVEERLRDRDWDITVAVMGCVVNGPGEASHADYGIAGGRSEGMLFKHGVQIARVPTGRLADALVELIESENQ